VGDGLSDERVWVGHGRGHLRSRTDAKSTRREVGWCVEKNWRPCEPLRT
jgi:hypothetical protein